jgi:hypothetical protein
MTFFLELIIALGVALILSAMFAWATQRAGRRTGLIWIFLLMFFATWAGGAWLKPFGPTLWGVHWLSFLTIGIIVALVLAVLTPQRGPRGRHETLDMLERIEQEKELEKIAYITLSVFFWILLAVLALVLVIRYVT